LPNWIPASQLPELAIMFMAPPPMPTPPVPPTQQ
jgi:hypothetical protein